MPTDGSCFIPMSKFDIFLGCVGQIMNQVAEGLELGSPTCKMSSLTISCSRVQFQWPALFFFLRGISEGVGFAPVWNQIIFKLSRFFTGRETFFHTALAFLLVGFADVFYALI